MFPILIQNDLYYVTQFEKELYFAMLIINSLVPTDSSRLKIEKRIFSTIYRAIFHQPSFLIV